MVITLEPPSAVSVGLCLAHIACDKRAWLERLGVEADWPMSGKPKLLYLDNAAEFKSEALRRGCEQHGIQLNYRPPGQPQYGGIVERVIGTAMQRGHELPGTTFSNPDQRGEYDSEQLAALTLLELERTAGLLSRWPVTTALFTAAYYRRPLYVGLKVLPSTARLLSLPMPRLSWWISCRSFVVR